MNKIKQDILNKIKEGEIKKTSPWYFTSKDYFFKILFGVSVVIGSFGFSSALVQLFVKPDDHMRMEFSKDWFEYFLVSAPYLWIVFLLIFTLIGWFNFKNTENGYKKNNLLVIIISVLISVVLGSVLFASGAAHKMDSELRGMVKPYKNFQDRRMDHRKEFLNKVKERRRGGFDRPGIINPENQRPLPEIDIN